MTKRPWQDSWVRNDMWAPHNRAWNRDNPFKPWNRPFGDASELTQEERDYYVERGVLDREQEGDK